MQYTEFTLTYSGVYVATPQDVSMSAGAAHANNNARDEQITHRAWDQVEYTKQLYAAQ